MKNNRLEQQLQRYSLPVPGASTDRRIEGAVRMRGYGKQSGSCRTPIIHTVRKNLYILAGVAATVLIALHLHLPLIESPHEIPGNYSSIAATGTLYGMVAPSTTSASRVFSGNGSGIRRITDCITTAQDARYYTRRNSWHSIRQ